LKPLFFVMENVPDLDSYEDENGLLTNQIESAFRSLNYRVAHKILLASDFGVPQNRSRLFFVGLHESLGIDVCWPDSAGSRQLYGVQTLRTVINDLPCVSDGHLKREMPYHAQLTGWLQRWFRAETEQQHIIFDHITRPHREDDKADFRQSEEGQCFVDVPEERRRYRADIFPDKYRKLMWDSPAWTITAHMRRDSYRYIHPQQEPPRTLSVREAARLQSFPDRWRFAGYRSNAFTQIGNAVPPLLARALARVIMAQLTGHNIDPDPLLQI